ncbi:putative translocon-associated protein TRAP alpha subunit [Paratrimastix pyriformis]|uniref:Translocon-associated protein TRAP alpha subunit n=1 Tax=Paratrimastix pyriformis TaxID=342808 RepID=A0ABQ8UK14_9EUKA|nr:putative translocon-associated protein TRAP alpha subunit [Paratrimastix pyriformis]
MRLLCAFLLLLTAAFADQVIPPHILTNMPSAHPDVLAACHFPPISADKKFHPGDIVDALVTVANDASSGMIVTNVAGALTSPYDFNMYYQNFTDFDYNITVRPEEEWTVHYKFQADPRIEPRTMGMIIAVFYHDEAGKNFSNIAYNGTFEFSDFPDKIDTKTFFGYLGGLAAVVMLGIFGYKPVMEMMSSKRTKSAPKTGDEPATETDQWLKGTAAEPRQRQASKSRSPSRSRSPRSE